MALLYNGDMRLRIVKRYKYYPPGCVVYVSAKFGKFLLKNGYAIQSRDMTTADYKNKGTNDDQPRNERTNLFS